MKCIKNLVVVSFFSALLLDVSRNGFRKGMPASPALACSNLYR